MNDYIHRYDITAWKSALWLGGKFNVKIECVTTQDNVVVDRRTVYSKSGFDSKSSAEKHAKQQLSITLMK